MCVLKKFLNLEDNKPDYSLTHSYVFLFSKEAHANVVPERGALGHGTCCHSVLVHGHIKVTMRLHHAACSQDGLETKTVIRKIWKEDVTFEAAHDKGSTVPHDSKSPSTLTELQ